MMGTVIHRVTIVTSWNLRLIRSARRKAGALFQPGMVTTVMKSPVNAYGSFAILTCGSKLGWLDCDMDDKARQDFLKWVVDQAYSDGSSALEVVDVAYGGDADAPSARTP